MFRSSHILIYQIQRQYQLLIMINLLDVEGESEEESMLKQTNSSHMIANNQQSPPLKEKIVKYLRSNMKRFQYYLIFFLIAMAIGLVLFCRDMKQKDLAFQETTIDKKNGIVQETYHFIQKKYLMEIAHLRQNQISSTILPKIFWLYTEFKFESEKMYEQMLGNYLKLAAEASGFEVRLANSWSAYDWLSPETERKITKTKHQSLFEHKVDDLLRWGLLMDHGGVMVKLSENFLIENNFDWLGKYLQVGQDSKEISSNKIFLFSQQEGFQTSPRLQDYFIAAVKNATLVREVFDIICETLVSGTSEFKRVNEAIYTNDEVNSKRIRDLPRNIIQALIDDMTKEYYEVATVSINISKFIRPDCRDRLPQLLQLPEWEYKQRCGIPIHIIHLSNQIDRPRIEEELDQLLIKESLKANPFSYWNFWMTIPQNKKLFDPLPPRSVSFCLLDAHPSSDPVSIEDSLFHLKQQTFKSWTAVYFIDKLTEELSNLTRKGNFKVILVEHTGSVGRNYQVGIIRHCPSKSFVIVLRNYQRIKGKKDLEKLATKVTPRGVLGVFAGVEVNSVLLNIESNYYDYNKVEYNGKEIKYKVLNEVLNHLRVFHSDCYKIIPQFELRTHDGVYFNDRFVFLEHFMIMVRNLTYKHDDTEIPHQQRVKWFIKSNSHLYDVPNSIVIDHDLVIITDQWEEVDKQQIKRNIFKLDPYAMTFNADHLVQNGIPMSQFAVYNPGDQYETFDNRKKPPLIPKKVHIIWIEGKMPPTKQKIFELNQELYPDFQFNVWSKENITQEEFPMSYDLLQNVYNMENISRYSKRATMADIMRHEIMYNHGGFYMDTSMNLFDNVFYKWLSYKLALATERPFRHRWAQSMCIFGVMPKFHGLLRIISHNNTNRYNLWLRDALEIAGPHNFRWMVRGMEEYDPDYLIMSYDTFYPITYSIPDYFDTYCYIDPKYLSKDDVVVLELNGKQMIRNCGKYYPYSFGKEINSIGSSWQSAKW